jgi:hypothetical protein
MENDSPQCLLHYPCYKSAWPLYCPPQKLMNWRALTTGIYLTASPPWSSTPYKRESNPHPSPSRSLRPRFSPFSKRPSSHWWASKATTLRWWCRPILVPPAVRWRPKQTPRHLLLWQILRITSVVLKPMNEDFKIKYMRTSMRQYTRILRSSIRGLRSFIFKATRQVSLNILHQYFSIYSVELQLHDRNVGPTHLCWGLTRIDLSFLESFKVFLGRCHRLRIA